MTQNNIYSINPLVQIVKSNTTALVTCSTAMPYDNSIPQNTEGTEVLTVTIVPTVTTSILEIIFAGYATGNGTPTSINVALFQDTTADALSASGFAVAAGSIGISIFLRHIMVASTTSSTVFKINIGPNSGTAYLNGKTGGTRLYGGVSSATLSIREFRA